MSEEQKATDPMADYEAQLEQHEFLKREGLAAYADMLLEMLGDKIDPDKKILVKEGLVNMLSGPPRMPMISPPFATPLKLPPPPSPYFREESPTGVTVWDWRPISSNATHCRRTSDGVSLFYYDELLITLRGEAAEKYWEYQEAMTAVPLVWGPSR